MVLWSALAKKIAGLRTVSSLPLPIAPITIHIEICSMCNLRCVGCIHGNKNKGAGGAFKKSRPKKMAFESFKKVMDTGGKYAQCLNLTGTGETFLNPDTYDIVGLANRYGLETFIGTNGHNCDTQKILDSGLSRIVFALDGFSQETYETYRRGGNCQEVIDNITSLSRVASEQQSDIKIIVKYLVTSFTEGELPQARAYFEKFSNVEFSPDYFHIPLESEDFVWDEYDQISAESYEKWSPKNEFVAYEPGENGNYRFKFGRSSVFENRCQAIYNDVFINSAGDVYPCCEAGVPEEEMLLLGNAYEEGLLDIFNGEKARKLRMAYIDSGGKVGPCATCFKNRKELRPLVC